jgi:hypothetical protein
MNFILVSILSTCFLLPISVFGQSKLDDCMRQLKGDCTSYAGYDAVVRCSWIGRGNYTANCSEVFKIIFQDNMFAIANKSCSRTWLLSKDEVQNCKDVKRKEAPFEAEASLRLQVLVGLDFPTVIRDLKRKRK